MAWPSNPIGKDAPSGEPAPDVLERFTFEGPGGVDRLNGPLAVTCPSPADFRATLHRASFSSVALEYFEATAHSVVRGPAQIAEHPQALQMVVFVLEGELQVQTDDRCFIAAQGDTMLMDTRSAAASWTEAPIRLLRAIVDPEQLPDRTGVGPAPIGPLPRTPLVESYRAFVAAVLRAAATATPSQSSKLPTALLQLHDAVLAEAQQVAQPSDGPAALRGRIAVLIEQQHTDGRFDVAAIAHALEVSVRHVHAVYNRGGRTVGRALKDRRAETAAHLLDTAEGAVRLGDIARSSGFTDRDCLNRAFQERYGCTPAEYRERPRP